MQQILSSLFDLGIEYKEVGPKIILLENFIQKGEADLLWDIIDNASQEDWEIDYRNSQIKLAQVKYGRDDLDNLIAEGLVEYSDFWSDNAIAIPQGHVDTLSNRIDEIFMQTQGLYFTGLQTIHRHYEGSVLVEHVDSHGDPYVQYAVIGYLNHDYADGELVFPNLGIELKPPKNSILIFPDGELYKHGVKAPGTGPIRYSLPAFLINEDGLKAYQRFLG
jgi:hypothetical protein